MVAKVDASTKPRIQLEKLGEACDTIKNLQITHYLQTIHEYWKTIYLIGIRLATHNKRNGLNDHWYVQEKIVVTKWNSFWQYSLKI